MAEIEGLVRDLREGDDAAKTDAARRLGHFACSGNQWCVTNRVLIAEVGGIPPLVELLRDGSADAKLWAARALRNLARRATNQVLIAEAGGIPPLVELLRDGSADAKLWAAWALDVLTYNDANKVLTAEAGGIPPLLDLVRNGSRDAKAMAAWALGRLSRNNDANRVAIAEAVGFEALVQLARGGRVTVDNESIVRDAGVPAKRKAALVVAALLGDCVPDSVPREIKTVIGPYL